MLAGVVDAAAQGFLDAEGRRQGRAIPSAVVQQDRGDGETVGGRSRQRRDKGGVAWSAIDRSGLGWIAAVLLSQWCAESTRAGGETRVDQPRGQGETSEGVVEA